MSRPTRPLATPTPRTSSTSQDQGGLDSPFQYTPRQSTPRQTATSRPLSSTSSSSQSLSTPAQKIVSGTPRNVAMLRQTDRSDGEGYRSDRSSREGSTSGSGTDEVFGAGGVRGRGFVGTNARKTLSGPGTHSFVAPWKAPAPTHQTPTPSSSQAAKDVTPRPAQSASMAGQQQRQLGVTGVLENRLRGCFRVFTSVATTWRVTGF
ncbi:hypothetical protein HD553DRAFT_345663 [Filobasidium floriforme]|uniref:uncharacterized protein n=1 Tax=Filobasidium floriforme TaxID=5210 RepID=UPI001E8E7365|nr:uncharacterized protein HD553DRAFT_345663 [Filobasidium floriforme]KAH8079323.1 hypothetical protein HD553DRAFT_345663 [Filobasidium floriforme]